MQWQAANGHERRLHMTPLSPALSGKTIIIVLNQGSLTAETCSCMQVLLLHCNTAV